MGVTKPKLVNKYKKLACLPKSQSHLSVYSCDKFDGQGFVVSM